MTDDRSGGTDSDAQKGRGLEGGKIIASGKRDNTDEWWRGATESAALGFREGTGLEAATEKSNLNREISVDELRKKTKRRYYFVEGERRAGEEEKLGGKNRELWKGASNRTSEGALKGA